MWINTIEFSPVATGKEICDAHPLSLEMKEWVKIQLDRIKNGYTVGGQYITGAMYFFLNFYKMIDKKSKKYMYPRFLDFQAEFSAFVQKARDNHKGVICLKRRQAGISEYIASEIIREMWFNEASTVYVACEAENQLEPLQKYTSNFINVLNTTPFKKNLRANTTSFKKLGYQTKGDTVWKGSSSELHFLSFGKANVMASVGSVPSMVVIDEAGKAKNLLSFYGYIEPPLKGLDGTLYGLPIIFGASGETKESKDLQTMFYEPDAYNMLSYQYEEGVKETGFFVEGWRMYDLDENGNSNKQKGIEKINKERERIRKSKDETKLMIEITQFPLTPEEAFLDNGVNIFDRYKIKEQQESLVNDSMFNKLEVGEIHFIDKDVVFESKGKYEYIDKDKNLKGRFVILEHPEKINNKIPDDLYIIGADPYHLDEGTSKGAIYVFKRMTEHSTSLSDLIVAEYLYRPSNTSKFAEDILKLCYYYNARAMVEPSTNVVKDYFWTNNLMFKLAPTPRIVNTDLSKQQNSKVGFPINNATKSYIIGMIGKYIDESCDKIYFPRLLDELYNYNTKDNFDLVMAFAQVIAFRADLWDWRKKEVKKSKTVFNPLIEDARGNLIYRQ